MKIESLFRVIAGTILVLAISSCEEEQSLSEKQTELLKGTWALQSVSVDGTDQTSLYSGLQVTFSGKTYSSNRTSDPIWPSSGDWSYQDKNATVILRDDGLEMQITALTKDAFDVSFTWSQTSYKVTGSGRVGSISGRHEFRFRK